MKKQKCILNLYISTVNLLDSEQQKVVLFSFRPIRYRETKSILVMCSDKPVGAGNRATMKALNWLLVGV